jgi:regulator of replication initiation timing
MDALNTFGLVFGIGLAVLSAAATVFNKQRFEAQIALLQAGNDELRGQNNDLRLERTDLKADLAASTARAQERERALQEYKDQNFGVPIAQLTTLTSNNHKEVMSALARIISHGR